MNQGHLSVVVKQVWEKIAPKDKIKVNFTEKCPINYATTNISKSFEISMKRN